jgi:hypothetical protein
VGAPVFTIILLGRWASVAFLLYISKQLKDFSKGVSNKMIQNENFFTITNTSFDASRTPTHPSKHTSCRKIGLCFKGPVTPLASMFH